MSDRLVRFPGTSWEQIEALPQPLRWTVQRTIFQASVGAGSVVAAALVREDILGTPRAGAA